MADNKNQHFVPRCHLKPFTKDGAGVAINLFNLKQGRAIADAPVKNQSSRDYFYGKDRRLEDAIGFAEGNYATVVADILSNPGPVKPGHEIVLRRFTYLQHLRTESRSRAMAERTFTMTDLPGLDMDRPSLKDAMRDAVQTAMLHYASTMGIVDDLKVCLVRNETNAPFFTSDDPAVQANRWHQRDARTRGRSFGVGTAGLIFLLPLSPEVLCLLYDGDVYSVPKAGGWIAARKTADVQRLNEHQILNCAANLYFRAWEDRDGIASQVAAVAPGRPSVPMEVITAVLGEWTEWGSRYDVVPKESLKLGQDILVHVLTNHPRPSGWRRLSPSDRAGRCTETTLVLASPADGSLSKASSLGLATTSSARRSRHEGCVRDSKSCRTFLRGGDLSKVSDEPNPVMTGRRDEPRSHTGDWASLAGALCPRRAR